MGKVRLNACQQNLGHIARAMASYVDEHGWLRPARTLAADGTPLHSRRTLLLPSLGERRLFDTIDPTLSWVTTANDEPLRTRMHGRTRSADRSAP